MGAFTDIFIRRPVLACVLSLLILLSGLAAYRSLALREYPAVTFPVITVTTVFDGANAEQMQALVTSPLQRAIASANGIDYVSADTTDGKSIITAQLWPGYDIDSALIEINSKVGKLRKRLPKAAEDPVIEKAVDFRAGLLYYLTFSSKELNPLQISEYVDRVVIPQLNTVPGIGDVTMWGDQLYTMRVWLDPERMAANNVTAEEVKLAVEHANVAGVAGKIRGDAAVFRINPDLGLKSVEDFERLPVREEDGATVRLRDIGRVELGADKFLGRLYMGDTPTIMLSVQSALMSNPLEVGQRIRALFPDIRAQMPEGLDLTISFDSIKVIDRSIKEVVRSLFEAGLIVVITIFLFLGTVRSAVIPMVTIPISLIGSMLLILLFGFSLNILTLLAMVLAIGLVVDDAIVVVENIQRHIEEGMSPLDASLRGAREIAFPVVVMTLTLAAVYAPIGLLEGLTGHLFKEFAFTLAGSVVVSGVVALTLSPMMCARLLRPESNRRGFAHWLEDRFERLRERYLRALAPVMQERIGVLAFCVLVLVSIVVLFQSIPRELAPQEDGGALFVNGNVPRVVSQNRADQYLPQIVAAMEKIPELDQAFVRSAPLGEGSIGGMITVKPWEERHRGLKQIQQEFIGYLSQITGARITAFDMPSMPGTSPDFPLKLVISTPSSQQSLLPIVEKLVAKAYQSGLFVYVNPELRFEKPEYTVTILRDRAAQMGVSVAAINEALSVFLSEVERGKFVMGQRSYQIMFQSTQDFRENSEALKRYYVRAADGSMVPLSTLTTIKLTVGPNSIAQFQQLNSATIGMMLAPNVSMGDAVAFLDGAAGEILPKGFVHDYVGQSRQFVQEGNRLLYTFALSTLMIYLVLAAQFESFRDPLIVLISVPMSICGALIPLALGFATLNIFTQIGLLTLIGLISKHGILIVDFANRLRREQGLDPVAAVQQAAATRLRPILMTTGAMVCGVLPLLLASGPGEISRTHIGIVITAGMLVGTLFTLFVVPTLYAFASRAMPTSKPHDAGAAPLLPETST